MVPRDPRITGGGLRRLQGGAQQLAPKRATGSSRYEEIAIDIATRIVQGEYHEGQRLFGRSSLAGIYKVSPETVRRAVALLHSRGIVRAVAGSGVLVRSLAASEQYLQEARLDAEVRDMAQEVEKLLRERHELDERLGQAIHRLAHYTSGALNAVRHVDEFLIPEGSALAGQTLASADLRTSTGITVIGVGRKGEEMFSPDPRMPLEPGDLLIVIGSDAAKEKLRTLMSPGGEIS